MRERADFMTEFGLDHLGIRVTRTLVRIYYTLSFFELITMYIFGKRTVVL